MLNSSKRPAILCAFVLAVLLSPGCSGHTDTDEMLRLSFWEFDQTPGSGWRSFADRDENETAARMIETYLAKKEGLESGQIGYLHYHACQLWTLAGHVDRALPHLNQAHVDSMPPGFPQSFNLLVDGTRSFILGDMEGVRRARHEVAGMTEMGPSDSLFFRFLDHITNQEGVPYREALLSLPEPRGD